MYPVQGNRVEWPVPLQSVQGNRRLSAFPVGSGGNRGLPSCVEGSSSPRTPPPTGFCVHLPAAFEEVFPGTLQSGLDPCQRGQRWEILPGLKALPIPCAEPRLLRDLLLRDPGTGSHRRYVFTEAIPTAAWGRLFRWHGRHGCENEKPATRGFTSLRERV
jgi:hypothetical protein